MGTKKDLKLIVVICILSITSVLIFSRYKSGQFFEKAPLKESFLEIDGYNIRRELDLLEAHVEMLKLDDYYYAVYGGPSGFINLYIGYYYSANKAYASHSPLICYPSQGWKIEGRPKRGTIKAGTNTVEYEEITTSFDTNKELVLYWYQAGLETNTQIYQNKIDMGYNKLMNNDEQHGFVRISLPLKDNYKETKTAATEFIKAFYPYLVKFITRNR